MTHQDKSTFQITMAQLINSTGLGYREMSPELDLPDVKDFDTLHGRKSETETGYPSPMPDIELWDTYRSVRDRTPTPGPASTFGSNDKTLYERDTETWTRYQTPTPDHELSDTYRSVRDRTPTPGPARTFDYPTPSAQPKQPAFSSIWGDVPSKPRHKGYVGGWEPPCDFDPSGETCPACAPAAKQLAAAIAPVAAFSVSPTIDAAPLATDSKPLKASPAPVKTDAAPRKRNKKTRKQGVRKRKAAQTGRMTMTLRSGNGPWEHVDPCCLGKCQIYIEIRAGHLDGTA